MNTHLHTFIHMACACLALEGTLEGALCAKLPCVYFDFLMTNNIAQCEICFFKLICSINYYNYNY
jgi:hypothetical protein